VRVQATTTNVEIRLVYQSTEGPWTANEWKPLRQGASTWEEIDLGAITTIRPVAGTASWNGRLEARTTTGTDTLKLDYALVIPTDDGYGKAFSVAPAISGVLSAYDQFTSTTAGNALNGRSATLGGTWATSGDATDYAFSDDYSKETIKRTAASGTNGRYAILGSTNYTAVSVEALVMSDGNGVTLASVPRLGVIARWTDSSNYLRAFVYRNSTGPATWLEIQQVVAGSITTLASQSTATIGPGAFNNYWFRLRLTVSVGGNALVQLIATDMTEDVSPTFSGSPGSVIFSAAATTSVLATGGTLATGKPGIWDLYADSSPTINRYYDEFYVSTAPSEDLVIHAGETMQIRHDDTVHENSAGTSTSSFKPYRGSRFLVPVGDSYATVKARRIDIDSGADANVTDSTRVQVGWTPRGLVVPR
jgi:hypothetical protein